MNAALHLVCGHCNAVVRTQAARIDDKPLCPRCRHALFDGRTIALTAANFDQHLTRNDLPLVLDVWALWCGPCHAMAPLFEAAAQRFARQARFGKVNSDEENTLAARFGVRGIPTLIAFRSGRESARQTGAMDAPSLERWLTSALA